MQMPLATARWLASKEGWPRFPSPSGPALEQPAVAAYFAAALLATRFRHGGRRRSERFAVMAFRAGPEAAAAFARRRRQLRRRAEAAAAAAAAAAAVAARGGGGFWDAPPGGGAWPEEEPAWEEEDLDEETEGEEDDEECAASDDEGRGRGGADIVARGRDGGGGGPDQLRPRGRLGWDDGGLSVDEELAGLWRRYVRAKGLVQAMAAALELRRAAPAGGADAGGAWGGGGCMMHLVHQGETLKRIAAVAGVSGAHGGRGAAARGDGRRAPASGVPRRSRGRLVHAPWLQRPPPLPSCTPRPRPTP
jgi:hypothetical protein